MKRIAIFLLVLLLLPCAAAAQRIAMQEQGLTFDYPESWLVVSPQLALVYAPLLQEKGIDFGEYALGRKLKRELIQKELS